MQCTNTESTGISVIILSRKGFKSLRSPRPEMYVSFPSRRSDKPFLSGKKNILRPGTTNSFL